ncbi:hypothetical protein CWI38_1565p0030 [Hamiltosporidium tvaerminnensis]|uniref:Uncharacterized protein n=1 Tax=Hamiltosporidium tvaerminnensis TaxID=1176355 RepID=A0A4Q9LQL4_9MICR|nr:hypothetical protein CWI38_1565p0030 [Hamiltosporidium tvaerminnensis]
MKFIFIYIMVVLSTLKNKKECDSKQYLNKVSQKDKIMKNVVMNNAFRMRKESNDLKEIKEQMKVRESYCFSLKECEDKLKRNKNLLKRKNLLIVNLTTESEIKNNSGNSGSICSIGNIGHSGHSGISGSIGNSGNSVNIVKSDKLKEQKKLNEEISKLKKEKTEFLLKKSEILYSKICATRKIIELSLYFIKNDKFLCKFGDKDISFIKTLRGRYEEFRKECDCDNEVLQTSVQELETLIQNKSILRDEIKKETDFDNKSKLNNKSMNDTSGVVVETNKLDDLVEFDGELDTDLLSNEKIPISPGKFLSSTLRSEESDLEFQSAKENLVGLKPQSIHQSISNEHLNTSLCNPCTSINTENNLRNFKDKSVSTTNLCQNKTVFDNSFRFGGSTEYCFEIKLRKREKNQ